jgi:hypothetical protein
LDGFDMGQAMSRVIFLVPEPTTCTLTVDRSQKFVFRGSAPQIVPREVAEMARNMNKGSTSPTFFIEDINGQSEGSVTQAQKTEIAVKHRKKEAKKRTDPRQLDVLDPLPKRQHKVLNGANA